MKKLAVFGALAALSFVPTSVYAESGDMDPVKGGHEGRMFEKNDLNKDGVITEEEFLTGAKERFAKMDADGNGEISKNEAKAMHKKMKEMKEKWKHKKDQKGESDKMEMPAE